MKARDLAALAALGVAGYAAYNKFGKKDEAPKTRGELGDRKSSINEGTEGEYRKQDTGKTISVNDENAGESEARMSKRSRQENDVPDRIMGRDTAGSRFTDRAAAEEVTSEQKNRFSAAEDSNKASNALAAKKAEEAANRAATAAAAKSDSSKGGPSRTSTGANAEAVPEAAPASTTRKFTLPGTQSSMGALSGASRPAAGNQAMAAMDRATVPAQRNVGSGNAAMDAYSQVQAVPKNIKYATEAEKARQARIDEKNYDSDLMRNRRQSVMDTVQNIPSNIAKAFAPPEKEFQNKTYRDASGKIVRYAKGGAVKKMASGGMTSSKMSSKPSTASSRGDGIAQRGKTRGKMC